MSEAPPPVDPVELTARLIRCNTVTPAEGGALALLEELLSGAGFACTRVDRGGVANLFARAGAKGAGRSFAFAGHVDVVPPGDAQAWRHDPFGAATEGGRMFGRGAVDMKSGVAAFTAAAMDFARNLPPDGAILLLVTGDEEGPARDGTLALLDWMEAQGERAGHCLVGEPTSAARLGDMMKIGRRGSLNCRLTATGVQGHSAYPQRARNPLSALVALLSRLEAAPLDGGSAHFDASTLAITSIDCGNTATNVIPARASAALNIRFNDLHSGAGLARRLHDEAGAVAGGTGVAIDVAVTVSGESFLTPPGPFTDLVAGAIAAETGARPQLSTSGGTSDARFIRAHCPVVEFGLVGTTMHQVDEQVEIADIGRLKAIYGRILHDYFA